MLETPASIPLGCGPAPAREMKDDPYPPRSKKSFAPLSSPFTRCDRVSRRGCVRRRREDGAAASGGTGRDGATATRR